MYDIKKKAWVNAPNIQSIASPRNYENMCPHTQIQSASSSNTTPFGPKGDNKVGFLTKDFSFTDLRNGSQHLISKGSKIQVVYGPATSKGLINRVNLSEIPIWRHQVQYDPIVLVPGVEHFPYCVPADHFSFREVAETPQPPDPSARQPNPSRQGPSGHQSCPPNTSGPSSYAPRAPSSLSYRSG
ncbi:hypothetical protein HETIRDRAFT_426251 [Heterobasidion irregulare TC 32-1]|uniref:Uncharacterized protein n=1 Tax=Heterobasidion irregulare (strain TC 32-1) TaxID=747525 RepID=W4KC55_HETIT|nr:uncharacterized protein HETIRDRAFT_426251 [Heterobasidion irregulare TC 32-1]ETW82661.1 hypothetical protein HETIRDRAFT_426251 [Heterobasidion irregulare TC 32-1]